MQMSKKEKQLANLNREGRQVGSKNKSTILREVLKNGFESEMEKDFLAVVRAVVKEAKDGDMVAAKLLFERILPVQDNSKGAKISLGEGGLTIVIERLEAAPSQSRTIDVSPIEEGDYEEISGEES